MNNQRRQIVMLAAAALFVACNPVRAQSQVQRIGGDIVAISDAQMQVKSRTGETINVKLAPTLSVSARSKADLSAVAPGAFLGTTAIPQPDGTLKATEVHVFPESMRGTGEGHRPYQFTPGGTMTNATVASVGRAGTAGGSTMTNATVAGVGDAAGSRTMKLTYKGGEKTVVIAPGTPIVMVESGDRSLLVPGAHIVVTATRQPDGALLAERVMVGKGGLVPPL